MAIRPFEYYQKELECALEGVTLAAQVVMKVREEMVQPAFTKQDESPVTVADFAAQALVAKLLLERFPQDPLVGEESAAALRQPSGAPVLDKIAHFLTPLLGKQTHSTICDWISHGDQEPAARFWTMDPIDGTKGYIRGDQYAVALCLIENGAVKVSVMACPNLKDGQTPDIGGEGTLACAVKGEGTWVSDLTLSKNWKRLMVSQRSRGREAVMLRSFERKHTNSERMAKFSQLMDLQQPPIYMDSLAKYVVLASGAADFLVRFPTENHAYEWIWDQAPGAMMVEEAGGKVTDLDGKPLDYTQGRQLKANRGVLISNGAVHASVLNLLED